MGVLAAVWAWAGAATAQVNVTTYHNDLGRTGQNLSETILTHTNVNSTTFGKLFSQSVDGKVYAQPLVVTNVSIPGQGIHNVVYVATLHDSVYAFDADSGGLLWHVNFLSAGVSTATDTIASCSDTQPEFGILGTPVIDTSTGTLYVTAETQSGSNFFHHLHAIDITTGAEKFGGPVLVSASLTGNAGTKTFNARQEINRPGLLLLNGVVYTFWGSHCDDQTYYGWVISYNAQTLARMGVFNSTLDNSGGSIWSSGDTPPVDVNGNLFVGVANGPFNANTGGQSYGQSYVKLKVGSGGALSVGDYFTPANEASMSSSDQDVASGGSIALPDSFGSAAHPRLLTGLGKEGFIYLIDRDNMGKFNSTSDTDVQTFQNGSFNSGFSSPACFGSFVYWPSVGAPLKAFHLSGASYNTTPSSQTAESFGFPGCTPSVSANGTLDPIVWAIQPGNPAVLRAYNANNLGMELYNSNQAAGGRDSVGMPNNKFTPPSIANGKVYVPADNGLVAYGLLDQPTPTATSVTSPPPTATPSNTPTATSTFTSTPSFTATLTPVLSSTWRVNAGGPQYTDSHGNVWSADGNFTGGTAANQGTSISGTSDPTLYDTQRYGGNFSYVFNVPAGTYQLTLDFAETYPGDFAVGDRVFNVLVNGVTVLSNLDVFAQVGANAALNETINNITPSGGAITIQFAGTTSRDTNAVVEALQIIPQPSTPTFTATSTATASQTSTSTPTNTVPPPTNTSTNTPIPPTSTFTVTATATPTNTFLPPTATPTNVPPTSTFTLVPPTNTPTLTPANTVTSTATATPIPPTATLTPVPQTATSTVTGTATSTNTAQPPTATLTPEPPTATSTNTRTVTPTNSATATVVPPTLTFTPTAVPPTSTSTPLPPTPTNTTEPPTATATRTRTPLPSTATSTFTPVPPTLTPTSGTGNFVVQLLSAITSDSTNSPHPQIQIVNTGSGPLNLNNVTVRYWFNCDCTNQTLQAWVDWAGLMPSGTGVTGNVHVSVQPTSLGGQTNYVLYSFTGTMVLQPGQKIQIQGRFNKNDWSNMLQDNDWSFAPYASFTNANHVTGYMGGSLVWGQEPSATPSSLTVSSVLAYPNPSAGTGVNLKVTLAGGGSGVDTDPNAQIVLKVYTLAHRLIWSTAIPPSVFGSSGNHVFYWSEKDLDGEGLANGVYTLQSTVKSNGRVNSSLSKILILR